MVFNKDAAPKTRTDFMQWYEFQTEWTEEHSYDNPENTTKELREWFIQMIKTFPAMNGPFASEDYDNDKLSDYCIGKDVIYVAFGWSVAEQAFKTMIELAERFGVGFFDVSSDNGIILFPENGKLKPIDSPNKKTEETDIMKTHKKPWWKIW